MLELAPVFLPVVLMLASAAGWRVQHALAEHHRMRDTMDAVRLVLGMLVTFAALVLGLLTSSAKGHFDANEALLRTFAVDLIALDQRLQEYGPDAAPIRAELRRYTAAAIADTWPGEPRPGGAYPTDLRRFDAGSVESADLGLMLLGIDRTVAELPATSPMQRSLAPVLSQRIATVLQDRWTLLGSVRPTLSWPFLGIMTFWLALVYAVFGLTAPGNRVVAAVLTLAALSLSLALWLILELDSPLSGLIHVSSGAMREALFHMDQGG